MLINNNPHNNDKVSEFFRNFWNNTLCFILMLINNNPHNNDKVSEFFRNFWNNTLCLG
jgi:hypothetical protein